MDRKAGSMSAYTHMITSSEEDFLAISIMQCGHSTCRPYRVLLQDSRHVSTCRFIES